MIGTEADTDNSTGLSVLQGWENGTKSPKRCSWVRRPSFFYRVRTTFKTICWKRRLAGHGRTKLGALYESLRLIDPTAEQPPAKVNLRYVIKLLVRLRNKVAHGSPSSQIAGAACQPLSQALTLIRANSLIFRKEWAYLHRNLSGKYRVSPLSGSSDAYATLKKSNNEQYLPGVYLHVEHPRRVDLVFSDVDLSDFFVANGGYTPQRFESLSYVTGAVVFRDSVDFHTPADELPRSTTHGFTNLEVRGSAFTNAPALEAGYVRRPSLEADLKAHLEDAELHRVVTLHGRGGVGKTSLALAVLDQISQTKRFDAIFWFSARDLDLLTDGPKPVKPHIFTIGEMGREFVRLIDGRDVKDKAGAEALAHSLGSPAAIGTALYVFDNFETIENPAEAFIWIDTFLRHPNKALITTRHREFKGDYPIEVPGMTEDEAEQLIDRQSRRLGIAELITSGYREELYREADGHPYVMKLLLGEVARAKRAVKVERIIASRDEMLTALFERTYSKLTPAAQRIFLTLCGWRSAIPLAVIQATVLRSVDERIDVDVAIEELSRYSFVEVLKSDADGTYFVSTPLAAVAFGKRKLGASAMKSAIEADVAFLQMLGPSNRDDIHAGIGPRIERLLATLSDRFAVGRAEVGEYLRLLQFLASKYPPVWLWLSEVFEERGDVAHATEYVRRFLEVAGHDRLSAWRRLAELCRLADDSAGEIHALVGMSESSTVDISVVSSAANRLNQLFREKPGLLDTEEKATLVRRLARILEDRESEWSPTDISRLGWLKLHLRDEPGARRLVRIGLELDPDNTYLINLSRRLRL